MQCLKCGRETQGKDVFCPECLSVMAQCPVKPGTVVNIPTRSTGKKQASSPKQPKPEKIIAQLDRTIRKLQITVAVLSVLLALAAGALSFLVYHVYTLPDIGFNYSTVSSDPT